MTTCHTPCGTPPLDLIPPIVIYGNGNGNLEVRSGEIAAAAQGSPCDVSSAEERKQLVERVGAAFDGKLDILGRPSCRHLN